MSEVTFTPRKRLGQHFLRSRQIAQRIVDAAEISKHDVVLEIGPGDGMLTGLLLERAGLVVAVEIDPRAVQLLQRRFLSAQHLYLMQADVRALDLAALCREVANKFSPSLLHFRVVANLPYYITSTAIRQILQQAAFFDLIVLTVQAEVAERIVARPPAMSLLGVSVQFYADPELLFRIPPHHFFPRPQVTSAVIRLRPHRRFAHLDEARFFGWVRAGFSQPRKQLANAIATALGQPKEKVRELLVRVGVDPERRAETLSLEEWARLAQLGEL
ncbi:MAG: 16S rRNA (adenine(1518)-N(6)/adenine(1519)-N(6))-dimethyltransferase RsmA [Thermoflexales bacterium]|nr:16S rRNA (adenine(1518)-N(6)/adenine(1519)-N(6))-dimethyltransferase RsmA [Thermoflexales bacterium]MDW8291759.1 16S rRNA (adenine(1518)-N(6)/adenine(1519)-N(6))-dimethyltransferase RsmA [Anaerolineae bacterium]